MKEKKKTNKTPPEKALSLWNELLKVPLYTQFYSLSAPHFLVPARIYFSSGIMARFALPEFWP